MKIAYFTPLNPQKSGISDFSEELLPYLQELNKSIDIFTADKIEPSNCNIKNSFNVYPISCYCREEIRDRYDLAVYQVGNNYACHSQIVQAFLQYGGIMELHDISLHHFLAEQTLNKNKTDQYIAIMSYCHGEKGKQKAKKFLDGKIPPPWEENSGIFTVNKHLIDRAQGVIVHSDFAKQYVKAIHSDLPVVCIFHHTADLVENSQAYQQKCREKLNISKDKLIFGSFGFASKEKRIFSILHALAEYKASQLNCFHYYIVGKATPEINEQIVKLGLQNEVSITGYTSLENFKLYMGACNIGLNLRYPTQGETSGSLHRLFGFGKPVIVTNISSFEEYPDDIVVKVRYDEHEVDDIYQALCRLTKNKKERAERGEKALRFAKENCSLEKNAKKYMDYFQHVIAGNYQDCYTDNLIDKLFSLGLTDDSYLQHLLQDKKLGNF